MAFDAQNNYVAPDQQTRFVHVATKDGVAQFARGDGHGAAVKAGQVTKVAMMGHTNVAAASTMPAVGGSWIEHATAQVGDMLSAGELSAAIALATKRQAAVAAYQQQERIDGPARAAKAKMAADAAAKAELLATIDARIAAHAAGKVAQPGTAG